MYLSDHLDHVARRAAAVAVDAADAAARRAAAVDAAVAVGASGAAARQGRLHLPACGQLRRGGGL